MPELDQLYRYIDAMNLPRERNPPMMTVDQMNAAVLAKLRAPFGCEFIAPVQTGVGNSHHGRWRIFDAQGDAVASVSGLEEGYARLIVQALNEHFERQRTVGKSA